MKDTVIVITRQGLGTTAPADQAFGLRMLDLFLHVLESQAEKPKAICFYTEAVKLVARGSPLEQSLQLLARLGVRLVACRTCVDEYGLQDRIAVGEVVGMTEIVRLMTEAAKVITV